MNDPIRHLLNDHVAIMSQVAGLRAAVADLRAFGDEALERARPSLEAVGRMMATQLHRHARKEDEVLFPAIEAVLGEGAGPTEVMRQEHRDIHSRAELFRATLKQLNEIEHPAIVAGGAALRRMARGGASAAELASVGAEIIELLDQHFGKEEEVLFPMCREMLSREVLGEVGRRIEQIEAEG